MVRHNLHDSGSYDSGRAKLRSDRVADEHVGMTLERARRSQGVTLEEVSHALHIRKTYLSAIEAGAFDRLPGETYAVGFLRAYGAYLDLDAADLVVRYRRQSDQDGEGPSLEFPVTPPEGRFPGLFAMLLSGLLILGGAGVWYYVGADEPFLQAYLSAPPVGDGGGAPAPVDKPGLARAVLDAAPDDVTDEGAHEDPAPRAIAGAGQAAKITLFGDTAPLPEAVAETGPAISAEAPAARIVASLPPTDEVAPTDEMAPERSERPGDPAKLPGAQDPGQAAPFVAEPPAPPVDVPAFAEGAGRVYGKDNADARVILAATADSWVQVRDGERNLLLTRLLRAGDTYRVPNRDDIWMVTGNAGGLEVRVDGKVMPPLGAAGAIRRNIHLRPESLAALPADG